MILTFRTWLHYGGTPSSPKITDMDCPIDAKNVLSNGIFLHNNPVTGYGKMRCLITPS